MKKRTRPPVVQDAIVEHVRSRIVDGTLAPGDRLPARADIQRRFRTSSVTVQRAFNRLTSAGFVVPDGPLGTFVSQRPPHRFRYVIAFPRSPGEAPWVRFWTVMSDVAKELSREKPYAFVLRYSVDRAVDGADYRSLIEDVRERRIAGVIFPTNPFLVQGTPILEEKWLPRVAIMGPRGRPGVRVVQLDILGFIDRALALLAERKRKRLGILTVPGIDGALLDRYIAGAAKLGMETRPEWIQAGNQSAPFWAENMMRLMFRRGNGPTPDALVITDDNLVEHACAGIVQSGKSVPGDLEVVAHCNFPAPAPRVLPIERLGYDIRAMLETCIEVLDRVREGKRTGTRAIMPVFESELPDRVASSSSFESLTA